MNEILQIIGTILGALVVGLLARIIPYVKTWLSANADNAKLNALLEIIQALVKSAEQLYHDEDKDGSKRFSYVCERLEKLGYAITDKIVAYIEGAVLDVNLEKKSTKSISSNNTVISDTTVDSVSGATVSPDTTTATKKSTTTKKSTKKNSDVGSTTDKVSETAKDVN